MDHFHVPVNNFSKERWLQPLLMMQHYLRYISRFVPDISSVVPDNIYGKETVDSVISDEQKNEILSKVINEIPIEDKQEIINEVLKRINKKCETDLSINIKDCRIML